MENEASSETASARALVDLASKSRSKMMTEALAKGRGEDSGILNFMRPDIE
jgi:hypothetical protein